MQSSPLISLSPSFNSYSSCKLADIAARVVEEFRRESESEFDDVARIEEEEDVEGEEENKCEGDGDDGDFEFPFVGREQTAAISADEIFCNGQIRPVFPIFGRDLWMDGVENDGGKVNSSNKPPIRSPIRVPLGQLMREDRDTPSCSSSESDELDGVPAETYCVWKPKSAEAEESPSGKCKKSNSTGSSKRWKFRDLLYRSNSDGRDSFVFLTSKKERETTAEKSSEVKVAGKVKPKGTGEVVPVTAAQEAHYVRHKAAAKDGERRRSYLPYKQDLVGLFANVNGASRNLHPV